MPESAVVETVEVVEELERLKSITIYEEEAFQKGYRIVAGIDEAGRGPLAGPVVAAACIIPRGVYVLGVDDSKKLSSTLREQIYHDILSDSRIHYAVGMVSEAIIDKINIYQATIRAMLLSLQQLVLKPDYVLVDAMPLPQVNCPCLSLIKGDTRSQSIAAASVIAKVTRDRKMLEYHKKWPMYGFDKHKGYATPQHFQALEEFGPCAGHRKSFEPIKSNRRN